MLETAIFAGGCFWCTTQAFDEIDGVYEVVSGYTDGHVINPTYQQVKKQDTGHVEATRFTYDPKIFSYEELLDIYWQIIDPTDDKGQFQDRGPSYAPVIFYTNDIQKIQALNSREKLIQSNEYNKPIVVKIKPATTFYLAEEYHQDFHKKEIERMKLEKEERKNYQKKRR